MKYQYLIIFYFVFFNQSFAATQMEERQMMLKNYPCMKCHENVKNDVPQLPLSKPHDNLEFKHMSTVMNCYNCHDKENRDLVILNTGEKVDFNQAYKICFQCHGEKKRDWENGTHGKQIGSWNGDKYKFVCGSCHEAHSPKFPMMKADPGAKHPRGEVETSGVHK